MNDALVAFIGALIGGIISGVAQYFILKYNYKALFAKTVSENRMIWIRSIRMAATKIISIYHVLKEFNNAIDNNKNKDQGKDEATEKINEYTLNIYEIKKEFYENINIIRTRLNPKEERHQVFDIYLKNLRLDSNMTSILVEESINHFIRDLMKDEWERVKQEAGGKYHE